MSSLFLFAHQDDEYGVAAVLEEEACRGARCVYLTDGAGKGASPRVRDEESRRVLTRLGVRPEAMHFVGSDEKIHDGQLVDHLERALSLVRATVPTGIERIYTLAWEGGHQDHDAVHLVALAYGLEIGAEVLQFPLYNGYRSPSWLFRVLSPLPPHDRWRRKRVSFRKGLALSLLCSEYASQRRSWLGLFPEAFLRLAVLRTHVLAKASVDAVLQPPHPGKLLYERRFGFPAARFNAAAAPFIAKYLRP